MKNSKGLGKGITFVILIIGAVVMAFPFLWMILTSLKTVSESMAVPPSFFPQNPQFENYTKVVTMVPFQNLYFNTAVLIIFRVLFAVIFSSMAAFAFAKLNFKGKNFFFMVIVIQQMLPTQIFIIPQYQMMAKLELLNSLPALVFPGLVSAFGTFFMRQNYMGLPDDLMEAAKLDGCNPGQIFIKIMLPLTKSSLAALAVFTAVFAYSDLMWPLIVNSDLNMMTLSSGLSTLKGQFNTNYPILMAGSLMAMWPMVLLYLFFQKQFIEGIALTGTKA